MHRIVAGGDVALVENVVAALEIGHKAAGLAHEKDARGHVPGRQIALPIGVEPTGGDISEIEGGGAEPAQPGVILLRGKDFVAGEREVAAAVMRQPAGDDGVGEPLAGGDAQALVVEEGALAALGDEEFVVRRIVGQRRDDGAVALSSAIDTAKCGMPCRKLVVPSSGSTIQRWLLSAPSRAPPSSPRKP